jgi:hypothetical protein
VISCAKRFPEQATLLYLGAQKEAQRDGLQIKGNDPHLVSGHLKLFEFMQALRDESRDYVYLSFVREPFERMLSFYHFMRTKKPGASDVIDAALKSDRFHDFLEYLQNYKHMLFSNSQCRYLAANRELGTQDEIRFENVLKALPSELGFRLSTTNECESSYRDVVSEFFRAENTLGYGLEKVSKRTLTGQVDHRARELFRLHNAEDYKLYDFVCSQMRLEDSLSYGQLEDA